MNKIGKLYLIPSPINSFQAQLSLSARGTSLLNNLDYYITENVRTSRRLIKSIHPQRDVSGIEFFELDKHAPEKDIHDFLNHCYEGIDIGLLSESGSPCVADPGNLVVAQAHLSGIQVIPISGPSSINMALMASGFNGQNFTFHGYIPIEEKDKKRKLKQLETSILQQNQTQIFIETPYRNLKLFKTLVNVLNPKIKLCLAADISGDNEWIQSFTIQEWKTVDPQIHKINTVFLLYK